MSEDERPSAETASGADARASGSRDVIEACSPGPRLELFARGEREGWTAWGNQAEDYEIGWETYAHNSRAAAGAGEGVEAAE